MEMINFRIFLFSVFGFALTVAQKYYRTGLTEYRIGATTVNSYDDAEKECAKDYAVLVSVKTSDVATFLVQKLADERKANVSDVFAFFIGLKRIATQNRDSSFEWEDDKTTLSLTYADWKSGFPNNENADCVLMGSLLEEDRFYRWTDYPCVTRARFICQRIPSHIRITPEGSFHKFNSSEFYFGPSVDSYSDAENDCISKSGTLAILSTKEVYDFVVQEIQQFNYEVGPYAFYFGLRRVIGGTSDSAFLWASGVTLYGSYSNWHKGEPDDDYFKGDCVTLGMRSLRDEDFNWRDVVCASIARYICQVSYISFEFPTDFIVFGEWRYYFGPPVKNVAVAQDNCRALNATLVRIKTEAVKKFLVNEILKVKLKSLPFSFYIGLERINANKNDTGFQWNDRSLLSDFSDAALWSEGDPDNAGFNENCVIMGWIYELKNNFTWLDVNCNTLSRFICQKSLFEEKLQFGITQALEVIASLPSGYLISAAFGLLIAICVGVIVVIMGRVQKLNIELKEAKELKEATKHVAVAESAYFDTSGRSVLSHVSNSARV